MSMLCNVTDKPTLQGTVPIKRVNFRIRQEFESIANFKILQMSFRKLGIEKVETVYVDKLVVWACVTPGCGDRSPGEGQVPG